LGGFLVLWKSWIAWLDLPSVLWSAYVNVFNRVCPLTALENRYRYLAGQAGYEDGFIQHYIAPVVYPGVMPERWGLIAGLSVLIWNVLVYTLLVVTLRRIGPLRAATKQAYRESRRVQEGRDSDRPPESLRRAQSAPGGEGYSAVELPRKPKQRNSSMDFA
jgi:hypothetical protein